MKYLLIILLPGFLQAKIIKDGDLEYQCIPKKTCEDKLKNLTEENNKLKKQLVKETANIKIREIITTETIIEKVKLKKHILSVLFVNDIKSSSSSSSGLTSTANIKTGYTPAITYQYQFNNGITPIGGVSLGKDLNGILGLGFEY